MSEAANLTQTAKALVHPEKGILAADESLPTIEKRFKAIGVESAPEMRKAWRELLFSTPGIEKYLSGVIMFDETIRQDQGKLAKLLIDRGIIPGIKVDLGKVDFPGFSGEKFIQGLDGLSKRLEEYKALGARFAKWRAVISISDGLPTRQTMEANMTLMAIYASFCQQVGLVPIVEPEVLMDGRHDISRCSEVTQRTLSTLFLKLKDYKLNFSGLILKVNMVLPGKDVGSKASPEQVAKETVVAMKKTVSMDVPGIVFLSGGQEAVGATANLNAINQTGKNAWELSFSFGRALQGPAMQIWRGKEENKTAAQREFLKRAALNSFARQGGYKPEMENL